MDKTADVLEMASRMEALAAGSEWERAEQLAVRLKSAILDIPEAERHNLMIAVAQSLERVQTVALTSRNEVTNRLSEIQRGRVATRAYGQPQGQSTGTALR